MLDLIRINNSNVDIDLIYKWCCNKFVYEWFEQRILSKEEIKNKYINKLNNSNQKLFYICYNKKLIGLVQYYPSEYKIDTNKNCYEFDLFIGEEEYLSKGLGKSIIDKINKTIFKNENTNIIILRPFSRNIRACKCYEKCGYSKIDEYIDVDTLGNKEKFSIYILINNSL